MPSRANAFLLQIEAGGRVGSLRHARSRLYHRREADPDHVAHDAYPHRRTAGLTTREFARANSRSTSRFHLPDAQLVARLWPEEMVRAPTANLRCGGQIWPRPTAANH